MARKFQSPNFHSNVQEIAFCTCILFSHGSLRETRSYINEKTLRPCRGHDLAGTDYGKSRVNSKSHFRIVEIV